MIKAIIFDAFGTLISTGNGSVEATAKILKLNNRTDIDPKEFYSLWKKTHRENINQSKEFVTESDSFTVTLDKAYSHYKIDGNAESDIKIMLGTFGKRFLYNETKAVIDRLKEKYIVCIGSNTDTEPLSENLERNGLSVDRIYTSESLKCYKPDKRFYEAILTDLDLKPNEILFVGDSLIDDVFGPQQIGIKACHVNRRNEKSNIIKPAYEVKSLNELIDIL